MLVKTTDKKKNLHRPKKKCAEKNTLKVIILTSQDLKKYSF